MKTKNYKCVKDLQGGDWCVGVTQSIEEWRENAIEWADSDGYEGVVEILKELPQNEVIDYIQDFWQIEIIEVKE